MSGARFYKSDLQMQTPVDRFHWRGPERLTPESTAEDRSAVAEAYVRKCYQVGLEIIAITEHNLAPADCPSLLPEIEAAIGVLSDEFGYSIVPFPGFEVEVPIGRGIHVLCLFEPGTRVEVLSEKLTALGLPSGARFEDGQARPIPASSHLTLDRLLREIQEDESSPGIVVLAHASGESGVMDSDKLIQWWSAEVISDGRLHCLELPHGRGHYLDLEQQTLTKSVLQNADRRYERAHPIATICSSDCKSIQQVDDMPNYIGFRHTWLKMGRPSVEGLRQAFLDHESRVRFGPVNPAEAFDYPQITSVRIRNAEFLNDQVMTLSPNMNVIIGGSGTGKSTILNYLRMCLGQGETIRGGDTRAAYVTNLKTVRGTSTVDIEALQDGVKFRVSSTGPRAGSLSGVEDLIGLEAADYFPVRFFGQREIYAIAQDRMAAMALLDDLHAEDVAQIDRRCADLAEELTAAAAKAGRLRQLQVEQSQVAAQRARSQAAIEALQAAATPLATLATAEDRARILSSLEAAAASIVAGVELLLNEDLDSFETPAMPEDLLPLADQHRRAVETLKGAIQAALTAFAAETGAIRDSELAGGVARALDEARALVEGVRSQLLDDGIELDSFTEHRETVATLSAEFTTLATRVEDAQAAVVEIARLEQELRHQWKALQDMRTAAARALNEAVPKTETGVPFVEVTVQRFGNDSHFAEIMARYRGDRRKISDDDWDALIHRAIEHATATDEPPNHVLARWVESVEGGHAPDGLPADVRLQARLVEAFPLAERARLLVERVEDRAQIVLRRQDGTMAGELEGGLSVGQKCTAILALLLALDTTPVVIDQPEDEIDNEFTFLEMVPLLRRVKERRQLIVVTHDPNIPVNGDAEMIYSLAAVNGRGAVKEVGGVAAVGALDEPYVRAAVEEIMEGSEQAFLRRYAKYGF